VFCSLLCCSWKFLLGKEYEKEEVGTTRKKKVQLTRDNVDSGSDALFPELPGVEPSSAYAVERPTTCRLEEFVELTEQTVL